jgi:hypothetical protein
MQQPHTARYALSSPAYGLGAYTSLAIVVAHPRIIATLMHGGLAPHGAPQVVSPTTIAITATSPCSCWGLDAEIGDTVATITLDLDDATAPTAAQLLALAADLLHARAPLAEIIEPPRTLAQLAPTLAVISAAVADGATTALAEVRSRRSRRSRPAPAPATSEPAPAPEPAPTTAATAPAPSANAAGDPDPDTDPADTLPPPARPGTTPPLI